VGYKVDIGEWGRIRAAKPQVGRGEHSTREKKKADVHGHAKTELGVGRLSWAGRRKRGG